MTEIIKTAVAGDNVCGNRLMWEIHKKLDGYHGGAYLEKNGRKVPAASGVGIMSLGIQSGDTVTVVCRDEKIPAEKCADRLVKAIEGR